MSDEPRLRLEKDGVVVSEYWYDNSTGETVVEAESGETYRFSNGGTLDTPALNTDDVSTQNASIGGTDIKPEIRESEVNTEALFTASEPVQKGLNLHSGARFGGQNLFFIRFGDWAGNETTYADPAGNEVFVRSPPLYHPPGTTPILIFQTELRNATQGETAYVKLTNRQDIDVVLTRKGDSYRPIYKEVPLAGPFEHLSTGDPDKVPTWRVQAKTTTDSNGNGAYQLQRFLRADIVYEVR